MAVKTIAGKCHCGAVRFEVDLDLADGSNRCNCSYCAKARAWFAFAKGAQNFRLLEGAELSEYRWTPPGQPASHLSYAFCRVCGVRAFARGELEALGGIFHAVHIPTLELSPKELASLPIRYINGQDGSYDRITEGCEAL